MPPDIEADMMSIVRTLRNIAAVAGVAATFVSPASAQSGKPSESSKPKPAAEKLVAEKPSEADANRYCASVASSIAEARIAWQTKRLAELDAQVRQRIADLEKVEASAREWIDKRDALMKTAQDDVVAIYSKMEPESAAKADRRPRRPHGRSDPGQAQAEHGRRHPWRDGRRSREPARRTDLRA